MADESYRIPRWFIGFVTTFIVLAIPWCSWVTMKLIDQSYATAVAKQAIEEINDKNWTLANQAEFILRSAILNPGMEYPDPRDLNKIIVVDKGRITNAKNPTVVGMSLSDGLSSSQRQ